MQFLIICHFMWAQKVSFNDNLMHVYTTISVMKFAEKTIGRYFKASLQWTPSPSPLYL